MYDQKLRETLDQRSVPRQDGCRDYRYRTVGASQRYGQMMWDGEWMYAHRLSYIAIHGPIVDRDACVLHRCDRPRCINPAHLFLGSRLDNARDMLNKRRDQYGRGMTPAKVADIRARYATGKETQTAIAIDYGMTQQNISAIVCTRTWRKAL